MTENGQELAEWGEWGHDLGKATAHTQPVRPVFYSAWRWLKYVAILFHSLTHEKQSL